MVMTLITLLKIDSAGALNQYQAVTQNNLPAHSTVNGFLRNAIFIHATYHFVCCARVLSALTVLNQIFIKIFCIFCNVADNRINVPISN